jgi:hypothetical protein
MRWGGGGVGTVCEREEMGEAWVGVTDGRIGIVLNTMNETNTLNTHLPWTLSRTTH